MNLAYGMIFLALTGVISYAVVLWWKETESIERDKEKEINKMRKDIESLERKTRDLMDKQNMMERNIMKVYRVLDPLKKNMYYEK